MNIEFDIQGLAELSRLWEKSPDVVRSELLKATTEVDELLEREIKDRTPTGVGGTLRSSIIGREETLADSVIGVVGTPVPYAIPVELGTKPHFPPIEPLKDWVKTKLDVPAAQVDDVAYLVARKIAARGTEGAHMFSDAMEANRGQIAIIYERARQHIVERLGDI